MKKQKSNAFGKNVYLLGADENGTKYWLEEGKWDCGWYWGFGYIETYTRNNDPKNSKDINSHEHADNFLSEFWNGTGGKLTDPVFSFSEGYELAELLKQFYILKDTAELLGRGGAHITTAKISEYKKPELVKEINEIRIPEVMNRIYQLLDPRGENNG